MPRLAAREIEDRLLRVGRRVGRLLGAPGSIRRDPALEFIDFGRAQLASGRHLQVGIRITHGLDQATFPGLAEHKLGPAIAAGKRRGARIEPQAAFLFFATVAFEAMRGQERPDFVFEKLDVGRRKPSGRRARCTGIRTRRVFLAAGDGRRERSDAEQREARFPRNASVRLRASRMSDAFVCRHGEKRLARRRRQQPTTRSADSSAGGREAIVEASSIIMKSRAESQKLTPDSRSGRLAMRVAARRLRPIRMARGVC